MKKYRKKDIIIILIFSFSVLVSLLLVVSYVESIFFVLIGWIIIPVIIAKIYRKIIRKKSGGML
ncbi:MAG: hypothetical protein AB1779_12395 [Candidatus Thermoplasmatota archaeon]